MARRTHATPAAKIVARTEASCRALTVHRGRCSGPRPRCPSLRSGSIGAPLNSKICSPKRSDLQWRMFDTDADCSNLAQRRAGKLAIAVAAAAVVLGGPVSAAPRAAENGSLFFTPQLFDASKLEHSPTAPKPDNRSHALANSPLLAPNSGSSWSTFGSGLDTDGASGNQMNSFRYEPASPGSANSFDTFKFGNSHLGFETQRRLQTPMPLRRSDCTTDEECSDYSGLSRSKMHDPAGGHSPIGNLKKPFIGLSVTTPIE
jgi:hypothetical protein